MQLGVIIPAYNAGATLAAVVDRLMTAQTAGAVAACWIIDDGSSDDTAIVAQRLVTADERLHLIALPRNGGYGAAMKHGLAAARAARVQAAACVHADGQYAPEKLSQLVVVLQRRALDLLQGSRIASGTALSGGMPLYKFAANRVLTTLENRVYRLALTDYHSGYLLYGQRALRELPYERFSDSFDFDLEVIASARARGMAIGEHPIPTHYGDEVSHLNSITYGLRTLRVMARYLAGRYDRVP